MLVNFLIVQAAPGGPVELMIARLAGTPARPRRGSAAPGRARRPRGRAARPAAGTTTVKRGARGIDPELVRQLEKQFGFDRPAGERFVQMMRSYLVFDFGTASTATAPSWA